MYVLPLPFAGQTPLLPGESDIGQLGLVVEMFGTINEETWPGVSELPDFKKINFFHAEPVLLAETLPDASSGAIGLLERLLQVVPGELDLTFSLGCDNAYTGAGDLDLDFFIFRLGWENTCTGADK